MHTISHTFIIISKQWNS